MSKCVCTSVCVHMWSTCVCVPIQVLAIGQLGMAFLLSHCHVFWGLSLRPGAHPQGLDLGASQLQGPAHLYLLYSGMCPPPCQASSNMNSADQPQVPMLIRQALSQVISRLKIIWVIKIYASTDACLLTWQCTPCGLDRVCAFWPV